MKRVGFLLLVFFVLSLSFVSAVTWTGDIYPADVEGQYSPTAKSIGNVHLGDSIIVNVSGIGETTLQKALNHQILSPWKPNATGSPNFFINTGGYLGINTSQPVAALDINGSVKVGYSSVCNAATAGSIRFNPTGPTLQFCDGTQWTSVSSQPGFQPQLPPPITLTDSNHVEIQQYIDTSGLCFNGDCRTNWSQIYIINGTAGAGNVTVGNVTANITANYIPVAVNGTQFTNSVISQNGTNVGIGTQTPTQALEVDGSVNVSDIGGGQPTIYLQNGFGTGRITAVGTSVFVGGLAGLGTIIQSNGANSIILSTNGNVGVGATSSEKLGVAGNFSSTGSAYLATSSGSVGIGTTTPQASLDVNGSIRFGATSVCGGSNAGTVRYNTTTASLELCNGTSWGSISSGGSGGGGSGVGISLSTSNPALNNTNTFSASGYINGSGLCINGNCITSWSISGTGGLVNVSPPTLGTSNPTLNNSNSVYVPGYVNSTGLCLSGNCITSWNILGSGFLLPTNVSINVSAGYIPLAYNSSSIINSAVFQSGANVGIGTASPQSALDVNGGIRFGATSVCGGSNAGTVRYNTTTSNLELCNGTAWGNISSGGSSGGGSISTTYTGLQYGESVPEPSGSLPAAITASTNYEQTVSAFGNGNVLWLAIDTTGTGARTYGVFDSHGNVVKAATNVTVGSTSTNGLDSIQLNNGNVAIAFSSVTGGNTYIGIAVYDNTGTAVVAPKNITTADNYGGYYPVRLGTLANGNFVVGYSNTSNQNASFMIFTPTGSQVGSSILVAANATIGDIVGMSNGNFMALYRENTAVGNAARFSIYNASGSLVAGPTVVTMQAYSGQTPANIVGASLSNGNVAVLFSDVPVGTNSVNVTVYDPSGNVVVPSRSTGYGGNGISISSSSAGGFIAINNGYGLIKYYSNTGSTIATISAPAISTIWTGITPTVGISPISPTEFIVPLRGSPGSIWIFETIKLTSDQVGIPASGGSGGTGGNITGTMTTGYLQVATNASAVGNSIIQQVGSSIIIRI